MAAARASARGLDVTVFDQMPSLARKFLMAGKSGLNITHGEPVEAFRARYRCDDPRFAAALRAFDNRAVTAWMDALGEAHFTGSSGRVFPKAMKASPLLRKWLARLEAKGVQVALRHRWIGWAGDCGVVFETPDGPVRYRADAVVLALGGGSWARLGSDGAWAKLLNAGEVTPFGPSNVGLLVPWSDLLRERHAGAALKTIALTLNVAGEVLTRRGEAVITERGLESGAVYPLSARLAQAISEGEPFSLSLDLCPDQTVDAVAARLSKVLAKESLANRLRKGLKLDPVKRALVHEGGARPTGDTELAAWLKSVPLAVTGTAPLDEAISTTGGVAWSALDDRWMLLRRPGVFCAGEMLDWDAPTGGYLLTACLATGRAAGEAAAEFALSGHGIAADQ